jgi:gamma-glutamylcyclotransferase (GGCT)/AIG2-like uncharacterized protein YtfP
MAERVLAPAYANLLPSDIKNKRHLMFVYGTLKREGGNHSVHKRYLAESAIFVGKCSIPGVLMYLGFYPGLVHHPDCRVTGEVWEVTPASIAEMDGYESVPNNFIRRIVNTPFGQAWCYYKNFKGELGDAVVCVDRGYWTGSQNDRMPYHKVVDFFKNRRYNEPEERNREPKIIVPEVIPESSPAALPVVVQPPSTPATTVRIKHVKIGPGLGVM